SRMMVPPKVFSGRLNESRSMFTKRLSTACISTATSIPPFKCRRMTKRYLSRTEDRARARIAERVGLIGSVYRLLSRRQVFMTTVFPSESRSQRGSGRTATFSAGRLRLSRKQSSGSHPSSKNRKHERVGHGNHCRFLCAFGGG